VSSLHKRASSANAFSYGASTLSTANLFSAIQPGGSLFGLADSNPVNPEIAYQGNAAALGTSNDPIIGRRIGGVNTFGGGLALYQNGRKIAGIGVSGDTSCTDHVVAYKVRRLLALDRVPGTLDKMIQDITPNPAGGVGISKGGFGHPECANNPTPEASGGNDGGSIVYGK